MGRGTRCCCAHGGQSSPRTRNSEDLPQPFGPATITFAPSGISKCSGCLIKWRPSGETSRTLSNLIVGPTSTLPHSSERILPRGESDSPRPQCSLPCLRSAAPRSRLFCVRVSFQ
eukprot:COSAG01_NODE_947_length_12532_cov_15.427388_2_plen_115_part_00